MPLFDNYAPQLETMVDTYFGERVRLLPYREGGYTSQPTSDPSRPVVNCVGYPLSKGSALRTENTTFITRRQEADFLIRIRPEHLAQIQQHDRLMFLEGSRANLLCEISYIEPSANGRPVVHLLKVKDLPT